MSTSSCRSCQAPIRWAVTSGGKRIPVDEKPVAGGNVELVERNGDLIAFVHGKDHEWAEGAERFTAHHGTCPQGKAWRR